MSDTYKALALVWVLILGLFALSGSGVVVGRWVLLLVVAALVVPLILTWSEKRRKAVDHSQLEANGLDLYRWENDGGAGRTLVDADAGLQRK